MATTLPPGRATQDHPALSEHYTQVRALTEALVAPLSDADATVQSMADASPAKWHLAHTTWFFETFVLRDHVPAYHLHDADWPFLFNSYYEAEGQRLLRSARGMLSRPSLADILTYREAVDHALLRALPHLSPSALELVRLGCQHEQQHQELLLTDILHAFSTNPLEPALWPEQPPTPASTTPPPHGWIAGRTGLAEIGHTPRQGLFAFDCEEPGHTTFLAPHALADRTVTNGEWISFIESGGYDDARLWLSDGWAWRKAEGITAPLYWRQDDEGWTQFTLAGRKALDPAAPVCHISLYEADAFASWAGARLPTEMEWEASARAYDSMKGHQLDAPGALRPIADKSPAFFGNVWEWTGSAYRPYPGFRAAPGAVGEYNGKFMSGQFVLRGGSCATPRGHLRASYRNFFYPHQRWQFMGLRLARDLA
ncbi:ergothioneine biosynthesis protein EgtB [Novosphingobium terrae]|uniref:ergothioneine biosynthesis protein EgtB n=1 Tax=Novosphingobium terrae TaxID=2726189 RepID=UPI00197F2400|nr:ergothioneine biosynthesis protein EgtB [Novosphingobium terrae]